MTTTNRRMSPISQLRHVRLTVHATCFFRRCHATELALSVEHSSYIPSAGRRSPGQYRLAARPPRDSSDRSNLPRALVRESQVIKMTWPDLLGEFVCVRRRGRRQCQYHAQHPAVSCRPATGANARGVARVAIASSRLLIAVYLMSDIARRAVTT